MTILFLLVHAVFLGPGFLAFYQADKTCQMHLPGVQEMAQRVEMLPFPMAMADEEPESL